MTKRFVVRHKSAVTLVCFLSMTSFAFSQKAASDPQPTSTSSQLATPAPATTPPLPNTLLDGTPVKLRLSENLSSESSKTGQQVSFEVTEEVVVDGVPVIPKGALALATVTEAQPKRRMGRG